MKIAKPTQFWIWTIQRNCVFFNSWLSKNSLPLIDHSHTVKVLNTPSFSLLANSYLKNNFTRFHWCVTLRLTFLKRLNTHFETVLEMIVVKAEWVQTERNANFAKVVYLLRNSLMFVENMEPGSSLIKLVILFFEPYSTC